MAVGNWVEPNVLIGVLFEEGMELRGRRNGIQ